MSEYLNPTRSALLLTLNFAQQLYQSPGTNPFRASISLVNPMYGKLFSLFLELTSTKYKSYGPLWNPILKNNRFQEAGIEDYAKGVGGISVYQSVEKNRTLISGVNFFTCGTIWEKELENLDVLSEIVKKGFKIYADNSNLDRDEIYFIQDNLRSYIEGVTYGSVCIDGEDTLAMHGDIKPPCMKDDGFSCPKNVSVERYLSHLIYQNNENGGLFTQRGGKFSLNQKLRRMVSEDMSKISDLFKDIEDEISIMVKNTDDVYVFEDTEDELFNQLPGFTGDNLESYLTDRFCEIPVLGLIFILMNKANTLAWTNLTHTSKYKQIKLPICVEYI